jgi:hypothetical protein
MSPPSDSSGVSLSTLTDVRLLRPQILLALLSDRTSQPRGHLPEPSPSAIARCRRQTMLRGQTEQLPRRDFHPLDQHRYWLHRRSARLRSLSPSARLDPAPSEFPTAAASPLLSVCIVASPVKDDIGLPAVPPRSPSETPPRLVSQWPGWFPHRLRLRHGYYALASMLPTGRHSGRSGRTVHENAVSYSAWHTHIACVGVLVLFSLGVLAVPGMPSHLPPCKHDQSKAPSLQRVVLHAFTGTSGLSDSLPAPRTFSLPTLYARTCPTRLPGRVSPVPCCSVPACHRLRPRGDPTSVPAQDVVCCLGREMSVSALPNTFQLTI